MPVKQLSNDIIVLRSIQFKKTWIFSMNACDQFFDGRVLKEFKKVNKSVTLQQDRVICDHKVFQICNQGSNLQKLQKINIALEDFNETLAFNQCTLLFALSHYGKFAIYEYSGQEYQLTYTIKTITSGYNRTASFSML